MITNDSFRNTSLREIFFFYRSSPAATQLLSTFHSLLFKWSSVVQSAPVVGCFSRSDGFLIAPHTLLIGASQNGEESWEAVVVTKRVVFVRHLHQSADRGRQPHREEAHREKIFCLFVFGLTFKDPQSGFCHRIFLT